MSLYDRVFLESADDPGFRYRQKPPPLPVRPEGEVPEKKRRKQLAARELHRRKLADGPTRGQSVAGFRKKKAKKAAIERLEKTSPEGAYFRKWTQTGPQRRHGAGGFANPRKKK